MSLNATRASTQDNTAGTQIATTVTEDGTAGVIQAVVQVGNKSAYTDIIRTGVTAADAPTGGDLTTTGFAGTAGANLLDLGNCLSVTVRATCTVASATLSGRVVFYDASNNPLAYSESLSFTSDGSLRLGNATGDFVVARQIIDAGQARKARFLVVSVSAGSWSIYARPI